MMNLCQRQSTMVSSLQPEKVDDTEPGPSVSKTEIRSLVTPSHISPVSKIKKRTSNRGLIKKT